MTSEEDFDECEDCHGLMGVDFCCACGKFLAPEGDEDEYPS